MSGEEIKEPETFREKCVKMLTHPATNYPRKMAEGIVNFLIEKGSISEKECTSSSHIQRALLREWEEEEDRLG